MDKFGGPRQGQVIKRRIEVARTTYHVLALCCHLCRKLHMSGVLIRTVVGVHIQTVETGIEQAVS